MRILVLAGEHGGLGPRATLWGLCRALRESLDEVELATTLPDETLEEDSRPPVVELRAACATARRRSLVLLTNDALSESWLRGVALPPILAQVRATTAGVAVLRGAAHTRIGGWIEARSLRTLGAITAADRASVRNLKSLGASAATLLPDPALLVPAAYADVAHATLAAAGAPGDRRPLLGVVPRRVPLRGRLEHAIDERLIALVAQALALVVARRGAFVVCLPAAAADILLCEELAAKLGAERACVTPPLDPKTFAGVASELAVMLSAHRRAALLAAGVGRPTVALGDPALAAALEPAGPGHAFLDAALFLRGGLAAQLADLVDAALEMRRTPVVRIEEMRASARAGVRSLIRIAQ
jgi:single-stranded DNA-specific DHH superfamily exonuclease